MSAILRYEFSGFRNARLQAGVLYAGSLIPAAALLSVYNGILNVFWSAIAFVPLAVFCYRFLSRPFLYAAGIVSLLSLAVPTSWLGRLELGSRPSNYRRFGVHLVNRLTQHGSFVKKLAGKSARHGNSPFHLLRRGARRDALVRESYVRERFHLSMLLFFLLAATYAVAQKLMIWAFVLTVTNVVYNLYPIWLQQYIRLRLKRSRC